MKMKIRSRLLGAVCAGAISAAMPASVNASFVFFGGSTQSLPISGNDFNPQLAALNFDQMTTGTQLGVSRDGFVDFFYIGAESGFINQFTAGGRSVTEGNDDFNFSGYAFFDTSLFTSITIAVSAGDILDFSFTSDDGNALSPVDNSTNTNLEGLGIFSDSGESGLLTQVILGYDDQIWDDDDDHDDMLMRAEFRTAAPVVVATPVPATAYLFISGLLGLMGSAYRSKALVRN